MSTGLANRQCAFCGSVSCSSERLLRELMFATGERFRYRKCADCDSLTIGEIPSDLNRHYPRDYYSFGTPRPLGVRERAFLSLIERLPLVLRNLMPVWLWPGTVGWLGITRADVQSKTLDVGCGTGRVLNALAARGWRHCEGIDPFLPTAEVVGPHGARIQRKTLAEIEGHFDLITFHHVLEHMERPLDALLDAKDRLSRGGEIVIRVPLLDSWAARHYGEDWINMDPPRHLQVPSETGLCRLADRAGLKVVRRARDSEDPQGWGSRAARRGVPISQGRPARPERIAWRVWAILLNASGRGDGGVFVLRNAND